MLGASSMIWENALEEVTATFYISELSQRNCKENFMVIAAKGEEADQEARKERKKTKTENQIAEIIETIEIGIGIEMEEEEEAEVVAEIEKKNVDEAEVEVKKEGVRGREKEMIDPVRTDDRNLNHNLLFHLQNSLFLLLVQTEAMKRTNTTDSVQNWVCKYVCNAINRS